MNILSIKGGGIKGIVPIKILMALIKHIKQISDIDYELCDLFNFCSGSSIGSVIISCLLVPDENNPTRPKYSIDNLHEKYTRSVYKIFYRSYYRTITSINGILAPKYSNDVWTEFLVDIFGDTKFGSLLRPVVFPSFDCINNCSVYFEQANEIYTDLKIVDVLLGTTAAPTYFEPKQLIVNDKKCAFIDSGMVDNNTAELAYINVHYENKSNDVQLVSIGCGKFVGKTTAPMGGIFQWSKYITNILIDGNDDNQVHELSMLLNSHQYDILNPIFPSIFDTIDNTKLLPQLITLVDEWISDNANLLHDVAVKILRNHHKN